MNSNLWQRTLAVCLMVASMSMLTGCGELLHNLQPHRLQHLNRGQALGGENYNFSVSDPIPEDAPETTESSSVSFKNNQ